MGDESLGPLNGRGGVEPRTREAVELVPASAPRSTRRYVVRVGDAAVEIGDDFEAGTLLRILEVLRAC